MCENGPIASEDEASSKEDLESDGKETLETISSEEQTALLKKVILTIEWIWVKSCGLSAVLQLASYVILGNSFNFLSFNILSVERKRKEVTG